MDTPLTIVVFGATGDLFKKKLAQAFFDLYIGGFLPSQFSLYGFSRKDFSDEEFRSKVLGFIETEDRKRAKEFVQNIFYRKGDIEEKETYMAFKEELVARDELLGACSKKLFYLAVIPELYEKVFRNLSASGLTIPCAPEFGSSAESFVRVLVEKPFGKNEVQAEMLDGLLGKLFNEDQIFRIDHYLAKETLQNIVAFRFGNSLFEPLWSRKHIASISIKMYETGEKGDLGSRGRLYDSLGALRDVGQNHLLQMLAIATMENPVSFSSADIRASRAALLSSVRIKKESGNFRRGQYEGYLEEEGVGDLSETETYFKAELEVDNERFRGVPMYLEHGKSLSETVADISITFKNSDAGGETMFVPAANTLTFHIQPKEGISIDFFAKKSGFTYELEKRKLSFEYKSSHATPFVYPYEKLLIDALSGDQTLFVSTDEITEEWRIVGDIKKILEETPLIIYPRGEKAENICEQ